MKKYYYTSPIGILEIVCENDLLISLKLTKTSGVSDKETLFSKSIKQQLDEYFLGKREHFNIKISPKGTDFQKRVYNEMLKIPYGKTSSYSQIAENIGKSGACRAVGSACNKNPIMIIVPCHRIISKNGNLSGYAYGTDIKEKLLNFEQQ